MKQFFLLIVLVAISSVGFTANYYCDPVDGNNNNDGSESNPWSGLASVMTNKSFISGDTIFLMSGDHGFPIIKGYNSSDIVILAYKGEDPIINRIDFYGASQWIIKDVKIYTSSTPPETKPHDHPVFPISNNSLIRVKGYSNKIVLDNCSIYSIENSSEWTVEDWKAKSWNGIFITEGSNNVSVINSTLKNTNFAIHMDDETHSNIISNSSVINFCGDGIRLTSKSILEYSTVQDAYKINGNHDDIIQLFESKDIIIRGNKLLSATKNHSMISPDCQGLGAFDGWFDNVIVENNLVVLHHYHAISFYGARNCKIINNTVAVNPIGGFGKQPWITIEKKKDGSSGYGNVISNNLTYSIKTSDGSTLSNNIVTGADISSHFVDPTLLDFHLKEGSSAINGGTDTDAPVVDLEKYRRFSPFDIGCYEYNSTVLNTPPVVEPIENQIVKVDSALVIQITATDIDGDNISFSTNNLPIFSYITDNGDGTATITIMPSDSHIGEYSNIQVIASDNIDNSKTSFTLTIEEDSASAIIFKTDSEFTIYPNPVTNKELNIIITNSNYIETLNIELTNLNGQILYKDNLNVFQNNIRINLPYNLEQGIYIITLFNETKVFTNRIVIN